MKTLSVYRNEEGNIEVLRTNEYGFGFKRFFDTEEGMLEHISTYKDTGAIEDYDIDVSDEFSAVVINRLNEE